MLPKYIKSAVDLVTTRLTIRNGFLEQVVAKGQRANPIIKRAKELKGALSKVSNINELLSLRGFEDEVIAAAGFSEKAQNNLRPTSDTIKKVLDVIIKSSGEDFRDEIVFRYLLTKGDSLGGASRNVVGASAGSLFINYLINRTYAP